MGRSSRDEGCSCLTTRVRTHFAARASLLGVQHCIRKPPERGKEKENKKDEFETQDWFALFICGISQLPKKDGRKITRDKSTW